MAEVVSGGGRDPTSHALARLVGRVDLHVGVGIQFLGKFLAAEGAVEFYWLSMILLIVSCHAVNWTPRWLPVLKLSGFFVFLMVVLAEFGFPPSCQVAMSTLEHFNTSMVGFQRSCLPPYRCSSYHLKTVETQRRVRALWPVLGRCAGGSGGCRGC